MEQGFFHPDLGYWQTISEPPPEMLASYPAGTVQVSLRPSENHRWDGEQWVEMLADVEELKARKNAAINAARLKANQSHFTFAGKQIAVDPLSRSDIDAAHGAILMLGAMPGGWPGGWKAINNEYVLIPDVATWIEFYGAMVAQGVANFQKAQELKSRLDQASTPADVEAISWD